MNMMTDITLKAQEEITFFDVADETLEIAGGATNTHASFTLGSCTGLSECPAFCRPNWPFSERGRLVAASPSVQQSITFFRSWLDEPVPHIVVAKIARHDCPKSLDLARDTNADIGQ